MTNIKRLKGLNRLLSNYGVGNKIPALITAEEVSVADNNNYFQTNNVETVLDEIVSNYIETLSQQVLNAQKLAIIM